MLLQPETPQVVKCAAGVEGNERCETPPRCDVRKLCSRHGHCIFCVILFGDISGGQTKAPFAGCNWILIA